MYSEDSKEKLFFLLTDALVLLGTYLILAASHNYIFLSSRFFGCVFTLLIVVTGIITDEYSNASKRGYFSEFKKSVFYGVKVWHCTPIVGQKKNTFMQSVSYTVQETDRLISVEF